VWRPTSCHHTCKKKNHNQLSFVFWIYVRGIASFFCISFSFFCISFSFFGCVYQGMMSIQRLGVLVSSILINTLYLKHLCGIAYSNTYSYHMYKNNSTNIYKGYVRDTQTFYTPCHHTHKKIIASYLLYSESVYMVPCYNTYSYYMYKKIY
jgi:hypothetical protein